MADSPPPPRATFADALLRPLHMGVLGAGGIAAVGALAAAGTLGTLMPALGLVAVTGLAYVGLVGTDLMSRPPPPPPPPPREPDDLDRRMAAIDAAALRLAPLFDEGGVGLVEAQARVASVVDEARETVGRTRRLRELLVELPIGDLNADVRALEEEIKEARDAGAREILQSALTVRKARRAGRHALVGLEERGRAALTLSESVLEEMATRLSRLAHEEQALEGAGVLSEIDELHHELSTLQQATAATLAEMGATR